MLLACAVGFAGALGAVCRYLTDRAFKSRFTGLFPGGTWTVNIAGSFLLGILAGIAWSGSAVDVRTVVGVGFCGGLTTWSAASWETVRLAESGAYARALLNGVGGLAAACAAACLGLFLAGS
jgi:CrcB protein